MQVYIGITTSFEDGQQRLDHQYVRSVENAGGIPVIAPMVQTGEAAKAFVDVIDGLILTGGPAIAKGLIGTLPDDINPTAPERVAADALLLAAAQATHHPMLGICYGMQLLNAEAGGTIYADVERQQGAAVHSSSRGAKTHGLSIAAHSHLAAIMGEPELTVNSRHIQAIAEVGAGFSISARAPDGTIEAIENDDGTIIGVQFHPERMEEAMLPLFKHLITNAQQSKLARQAAAQS